MGARANAIAERWIASARRECLDRMLITGERHVRPVLGEYIDHCNIHRPHRTLQQSPPAGRPYPPAPGANVRVLRRDRLGGLIREYAQFAKGDRVFGTHKVSLPDIGNGYFIHPADRVARQAADGEPRRIGPPHELDVLVFGSDGGGALYAVPAAKPGPVYRLRECSIKDGIAIAGDIQVVAVDYRTFLQRLEIAVETFAATGHPADL